MTTSMHLDKARNQNGEKRWALWVRDYDGIDKPDYYEITTLTDQQARLLEATGQVGWKTPPDWQRIELETEKQELTRRISEIDRKLSR